MVPAPFVEGTVFALLCCFAPLSKISWVWLWGSVSGLSVLFHWSICLFFPRTTLSSLLKHFSKFWSWVITPPALFSFKHFKHLFIYLVVSGLSCSSQDHPLSMWYANLSGSLWGLRFLTRYPIPVPALGALSLNNWTTREVPSPSTLCGSFWVFCLLSTWTLGSVCWYPQSNLLGSWLGFHWIFHTLLKQPLLALG